jgi:hypothetical protein
MVYFDKCGKELPPFFYVERNPPFLELLYHDGNSFRVVETFPINVNPERVHERIAEYSREQTVHRPYSPRPSQ